MGHSVSNQPRAALRSPSRFEQESARVQQYTLKSLTTFPLWLLFPFQSEGWVRCLSGEYAESARSLLSLPT
jgi:hypothetical protein